MGLCKCAKRKVTNLFCFEHDVNVCEYCLVSDHERCIVQSYVQWLQDSDYNPICVLCKNLLSEEPTVRLICYDVFHVSCLDKYASQLPATTAPAGYQCPKCKEGIFPPNNLVSPVVDLLKKKLEPLSWSRIGFSESLLQIDESIVSQLEKPQTETTASLTTNATDDESNGFVIVKNQSQKNLTSQDESTQADNKTEAPLITNTGSQEQTPKQITDNPSVKLSPNDFLPQSKPNIPKNESINDRFSQVKIDLHRAFNEPNETSLYHNRIPASQMSHQSDLELSYDPNVGMVFNIGKDLDRDVGDNKYQRRPLFEWLSRWIKSRQLNRKLRMTRQKKYLFIVILIFMSLFTMIVIFSRLGSLSTEDDPALDPFNNPNIRVN